MNLFSKIKALPFLVNLALNYQSKSFWANSETWVALAGIAGSIAVERGWLTGVELKDVIIPAVLVIFQRIAKKAQAVAPVGPNIVVSTPGKVDVDANGTA